MAASSPSIGFHPSALHERVRQFASVFKLRIGITIALTAVGGVAISPGSLSGWQLAAIALAVLVSSASAGGFNQYLERDLDVRMKRTRNRAFPSGRLAAGRGWLWLLGGMLGAAVGLAAFATNLTAALYVFLGAFFYVVVYTVWLKRRTPFNIVIGGLAGSFAVLAGAAAVDPALGNRPMLMALVLFLWTPPHFWSLAIAMRDDYAAAGIPMLPVVVGNRPAAWLVLAHTVALVTVSLLLVPAGMGWIYGAAAALGGVWFIGKSVALVRAPSRAAAMSNFHASLAQLSLLLVGSIVDSAVLA